MELTAITAVVPGGVLLGRRRGWVVGAMAGALTYQLLSRLLVQLDAPSTLNPTIQGVIIIAAVAYAARGRSTRRRRTAPQTPAPPQPVGAARPDRPRPRRSPPTPSPPTSLPPKEGLMERTLRATARPLGLDLAL